MCGWVAEYVTHVWGGEGLEVHCVHTRVLLKPAHPLSLRIRHIPAQCQYTDMNLANSKC